MVLVWSENRVQLTGIPVGLVDGKRETAGRRGDRPDGRRKRIVFQTRSDECRRRGPAPVPQQLIFAAVTLPPLPLPAPHEPSSLFVRGGRRPQEIVVGAHHFRVGGVIVVRVVFGRRCAGWPPLTLDHRGQHDDIVELTILNCPRSLLWHCY